VVGGELFELYALTTVKLEFFVVMSLDGRERSYQFGAWIGLLEISFEDILDLELLKTRMMTNQGKGDAPYPPQQYTWWHESEATRKIRNAYLTGPNSSNLDFVSSPKGVDAKTQTLPLLNLIAVDLPPIGINPNRANGLEFPQVRNRHYRSETCEKHRPRKGPDIFRHLGNNWSEL
jgi:hypothetical protein